MHRFRFIWLILLLPIFFCTACGNTAEPSVGSPDEPSALHTYTALLIDRSVEPAATAYFSYSGDTTAMEILSALGQTMQIQLELQSAEILPTEARITVGGTSVLCSAKTEAELRGYLNSIYTTIRQNYGIDKALRITAGGGCVRFGIDLTGTVAYTPQASAMPAPAEGELSQEDAKLYAVNLTYGMLGETEIQLVATVNEVIEIGDAYYYDISVSSSADPGSIMRRFAIAFDGLSAYLYNHRTDAFERF